MALLDDLDDLKSIPQICQKRFHMAEDAEAEGRRERLDDIRFVRLREQWPGYAVQGRNIPGRERPMLVVNRLMQFRNQVINEIRINSPSLRVRPVDDNADIKTAEILEGLFRHCNAVSDGDVAIDTAAEWQVDTGLGYLLIEPDYEDGDSWNQDLFIRRCEDPFKWWIDPNSTSVDGADMEWAIYAMDMPKADFLEQYPGEDPAAYTMLDYEHNNGWVTKDAVRVAKYYWLKHESARVVNPATGKTVSRTKKRCFVSVIAGDRELDRTEVLFQGDAEIPLIPVYGIDTYIQGKRHLEGLIRNGKDPQRMLNYAKSASAEHVALVTKAPWIGTAEQFENHPEWDDPNTPYTKLVYNAVTHQGQPLPQPSRSSPPNPNTAWIQIEQQAVQDMQAALGIYDAALSANPNEQSGRALLSLQRQASQGTFHFSDNLARSIKRLGKLFVKMAPKYYDTPRVARIIGEDGMQKSASIDPNAQAAHTEVEDEGGIKSIYNLAIGRYDVVCDVGPSYATRRQEAADSLIQAMQTPLGATIAQTAGDLVVKQFDWPMSQEISERFKRAMPPNIVGSDDEGKAPDPQMQQVAQQMNQMADQMQHMSEALQAAQDERELKERELAIKEFDAVTKRIQTEAEIAKIPGELHAQALSNIAMQMSQASPETEESSEPPEAEYIETGAGNAYEQAPSGNEIE